MNDDLRKTLEDKISSLFTGEESSTTASSDLGESDANWEGVSKLVSELEQARTIYYADTTCLPDLKGQIMVVPESKYEPRFIVVHSDDLDKIKSEIEKDGFRMVHLRDMPTR